MKEISISLGNKRLTDIKLPSIHNSVSYSCVDPVARCQDSDIIQQFMKGVRYFDFRVSWEFPMRPD